MKRGCPLNGKDQQGVVARFTSPLLQGVADRLYHCPVGIILRDHPWAYSALEYASHAERLGPEDWAGLSRFSQAVIRLVNSERERIREVRRAKESGIRDSRTGMAVRRA